MLHSVLSSCKNVMHRCMHFSHNFYKNGEEILLHPAKQITSDAGYPDNILYMTTLLEHGRIKAAE